MLLLGGCQSLQDALKTDRSRFLSPDKVVKAPPRPSVYPILPSLSPAEETAEMLPNTTFPTREDCTYTAEDYLIGPADILDVSVLDLFSEGLETVVRREVSASGYIDLPELTRRVRAEGRTEDQLKQDIRKAYEDGGVLRAPTVWVTVAARRQSTFSVLGAVSRPGTYSLPRKDMRLLDALALAGDVTQTDLRYVYVIRPAPAVRKPAPESPESPETPAAPPKPTTQPTTGPNGEEVPPLPKLPDLSKLQEDSRAGPDPDARRDGYVPRPHTRRSEDPSVAKAAQAGPEVAAALGELHELMRGPDARDRTTPIEPRAPGQTPSPPPAAQPASAQPPAAAPVASMPAWPPEAQGPPPKPPAPTMPFRPACPVGRFVYVEGRWVGVGAQPLPVSKPAAAQPARPAPAEPSPPTEPQPAPRAIERESRRAGTAPSAADERTAGDPYGWKRPDRSTQGRVIAINLVKLRNGDLRMNVVIRSNDIISVPPPEVGELYVMGEVARPGVYSLTGRRITVKQALAAAGNLGQLVWPENSTLIRRLGPNQEQAIPLNVEAICRGDEPDMFLKPDDVLAVGTDVRAPVAAVVRNAFRTTYGFGFIYDRNFADPIIGSVDSNRFPRW